MESFADLRVLLGKRLLAACNNPLPTPLEERLGWLQHTGAVLKASTPLLAQIFPCGEFKEHQKIHR